MSGAADVEAVAAIAAAAPLWPVGAFALSEAGRVDALLALQALAGWVQAQQLRLLAAMAPPDAGELDRELAAVEIGCALRLPPATVTARLQAAGELVHRLPASLALLEAGQISIRHANVLVEAVAPLPDELTARVEARVLKRAPSQTVAAFRAAVHRAVLALDPRSADDRHRHQMAERRVCGRDVGDGMGQLWAL